MEYVEPIKSKKKLKKFYEKLKESNFGERNSFLFLLGIMSGLRISDLIKLKVKDIKNYEINILMQKTKKPISINLVEIKNDIDNYCRNKLDNDYIFKSRKGNKNITRVQAWQILKDTQKILKLNESIGTHTLRKTFGYHYYKDTKDIATLMLLLGHANQKETLRYIGGIDIKQVHKVKSNLKKCL